jgi:signal peptidase I
MRKFFVSLLEVLEVAVIAVGAVVVVRHFVVQPFLVAGDSMVPNFENGDYLLIDELTYRLRTPARGEVMVFHHDEFTYYIKRVIGLPGEEVKIEGGKITIINKEHPDGFVLNEPYLPATTRTDGALDVKLGDNQYYMLGDNRAFSYDSRRWGPLAKDQVVGRVAARLWPIAQASVFEKPALDPAK